MDKLIYVNVKPRLEQFFCWHEWSDPQFDIPSRDYASRVCLKCGKSILVKRVRQKVRPRPPSGHVK